MDTPFRIRQKVAIKQRQAAAERLASWCFAVA
jgi:hypothetical protein